MIPYIEPIDGQCPSGYEDQGGVCVPIGGGDINPVSDPLPGLGQYLTRRYTSNIPITDQMVALDLITDVLFPACRGFFRQSQAGRLGMKIKRPAPYGFSAAAIAEGATAISLDNVRDWIGSADTLLLVAPHTNKSEVRVAASAAYSTDQNAVTISSAGGLFTTTNFSGCDGADAPATASITVNAATAGTAFSITIDGKKFENTTTDSDTTASLAAYIAGLIRVHPSLNRKYDVGYTTGDNVVHLTARFGTLTLATGMVNAHGAPLADPVTAPTLTASGSGSELPAGTYSMAYSVVNEVGETLLSKYKRITITAGQNIVVASQSLPSGGTGFKWYMSPEPDSTKLRFFWADTGDGFTVSGNLPKLNNQLIPDMNRTGVEAMRVAAVFSDREEGRTSLGSSNVIKASYSWHPGNTSKTINVIALKYRDASQDYRLVTRKFKAKDHIRKVKREIPEEVNGQAIDNEDQALRIGFGLLAERQDADFVYNWKAVRDPEGGLSQVALLIEEGDVVACTDDGSGVYNMPVWVESIEYDLNTASMPLPAFTGRKYSSRLYDDSCVEDVIPVISEDSPAMSYRLGTPVIAKLGSTTNTTARISVTGYTAIALYRKIEYSSNADMSSATVRYELASNYAGDRLPSSFAWTKTSESGAQTRYFRVSHSADGVTYGDVSNILEVIYLAADGSGDPDAPPPPTLTSATFSTPNIVLVLAASPGQTGTLRIFRDKDGGGYTEVGTAAYGDTGFTDTSITLNGTYTYYVTQDGVTGNSATHSAVATGLGSGSGTPPDGLAVIATDNGDGSWVASASWVEHGGSGDAVVERKLGVSGTYDIVDSVGSGVLGYDDLLYASGVNRTYYYRVRKDGISGYSNVVSVRIPRTIL
jgi:hypothetical protein